MGIDALIYVAEQPLPTALADLIRDPRPRFDVDDSEYVYRYTSDGVSWLALNTWQRLYAVGYERGHWPTIRRQIDYMRETFDRPVFYHGDHHWYGDVQEPVTEAELRALDALWESVGNEPYRALFRRAAPEATP